MPTTVLCEPLAALIVKPLGEQIDSNWLKISSKAKEFVQNAYVIID
ncbi:hypothetical protein PAUR_a1735 [Pseudoalteromonas aurantia 208]|uniref:Uncharacterized protein n=1 Tax=Pseudoalteromonas aurantia 208 TaxID=1314867 RepID=A0ABR9EB53_9GAMM|nr:hypothetical protein [Pseudoalteromonas aurantia 208]